MTAVSKDDGMVERVARALCEYLDLEFDSLPRDRVALKALIREGLLDYDIVTQENLLGAAGGAIAKMREPTEFMLSATAQGRGKPPHAVSSDIWQAMIDAALCEPVNLQGATSKPVSPTDARGFSDVFDPLMGGYVNGFNPQQTYEFLRPEWADPKVFRLCDQHPAFNIYGLLYRDLPLGETN